MIALQVCDVTNRTEDTSVMAEKKASRSGVTYCAAGGSNKANCPGKTGMPGISMHYFPRDETVRQKWTRFVRINRKDFVPTPNRLLFALRTSMQAAFIYKASLLPTKVVIK